MTTHKAIPFVCKEEVQQGFRTGLHKTSSKFRLVVLSLMVMAADEQMLVSPNGPSILDYLSAQLAGIVSNLDDLVFEHVTASYACFVAHEKRKDSRSAWYYLQLAITFIQILGLDHPETYATLPDMRWATLSLKVYYTV